jgi:hypothetical protein
MNCTDKKKFILNLSIKVLNELKLQEICNEQKYFFVSD